MGDYGFGYTGAYGDYPSALPMGDYGYGAYGQWGATPYTGAWTGDWAGATPYAAAPGYDGVWNPAPYAWTGPLDLAAPYGAYDWTAAGLAPFDVTTVPGWA